MWRKSIFKLFITSTFGLTLFSPLAMARTNTNVATFVSGNSSSSTDIKYTDLVESYNGNILVDYCSGRGFTNGVVASESTNAWDMSTYLVTECGSQMYNLTKTYIFPEEMLNDCLKTTQYTRNTGQTCAQLDLYPHFYFSIAKGKYKTIREFAAQDEGGNIFGGHVTKVVTTVVKDNTVNIDYIKNDNIKSKLVIKGELEIDSETTQVPYDFSINGFKPIVEYVLNTFYDSSYQRYYWVGRVSVEIPLDSTVSGQIQLVPAMLNGLGEFMFLTLSVEDDGTTCGLKIDTLATTSQPLDITSGGNVGINGSISDSSGQVITWTIKVLDRTFSGSGTSASATWDGKDASGNIVAPGPYTATFTAKTADGLCTDSKTINITVVKPQTKDKGPCDNPCGCNDTETNSTVNLKSGNYYHSQNVISKPESLSLDLSYNSLENRDIPLGKGWAHSYNLSLKEATGSVILKLGSGDFLSFALSGTTYLPEATTNDTTTIIKNSDGSYTRIFKNGLKQTFNSTGQLTTITDPNANTTTLTYSGSDLATITDSTSRKLTIASSGGRINSITDPAGRATTFGYSDNLLSSVTDPAGNSWSYIYDANGKLTQKTNPAGNSSSNVYDANGKNTSSTDPEGRTKTISYDSANASTVTEKDGSSWSRMYDPLLNVPTTTTDPLGNISNKSFDSRGNILTNTTPDGNTTSYSYDSANNMTSVTDALGKSTSYTYNSLGQVLTVTDPDGHITTNSYDAKGNLLQTTTPTGAKTVFTYNTKGKLLTVTDPITKKITYAYDASNNVTSITDQNAKIISFTYDTSGNLLTRKDPAGKITTYVYDAMNHLTKITDPLGYITQVTYDKLGNRTTVTDGNGKMTTYTYNYKNQPVTITDALGNITTMAYSATSCGGSCSGGAADKLVSVTDANNITSYEYNQNGKLAKETDPRGNITSYSYDNSGRLSSRTDGNAQTTTYTYDAADNLLSKSYQDGSSDTFTYDPAGNLLTAGNANISYTLTWDAANRLTGVTDSNGRAISYVLDGNGNRTKMTAPDGRITTYIYDAKNNLTKLTDNGKAYSFTYDTLDRKTKLTNPNRTTTAYTYDADSRLTALTSKTSSGTTINSISHSYDKTANRLTKKETSGTTNYSYDAIYRLIKSALGTTTKEQFTYDVTGNRTTGPTTANAYTIDQGNQLQTKTGTSYTYDNNGNQITKTEGTTTWHYSYDGENRLVKADKTTGTTTITTTYKYDPFGNRIEKTTNGVTTKYLYDGANIFYEYNGSNVITNRYTHNISIDDVLGVETGGKLYAYHKDTLGSIRTITDSSQKTVNSYSYDSFGTTTQTGTLVQPYGYTGRELDKETGLYYYRARYYDTAEGRFIQRDPIAILGNIYNSNEKVTFSQYVDAVKNPYLYTDNNPINWIDPTGLTPLSDKIDDFIINKLDPTGLLNFIKSWNDANDTTKVLHNLNLGCQKAYDNHDTERAAIYEWGISEIESILNPQIMKVMQNTPNGTPATGPVKSPSMR